MYATLIRETMARIGKIGTADPRHVEAWMRLEHPTLDGLSPSQFKAEVAASLAAIGASTTGESESLAQSFGL